jgi:glycosyltransferase involved in cell wall biosynthesis
MYNLECPIAESLIRPFDRPPVLSVVIPSYKRTPELIFTITSLADQVVGDLVGKVEILVSDNASGPETVAAIKDLADRYDCISYMINARNEGGYFQIFAAPWRARGRWTWVFGSDDVLLPGGLTHIIDLLEVIQPSFLTMNKRYYSNDLSQELWTSANTIPDREFPTFIELFKAVGINQMAFLTSNIELTAAARAVDPTPYVLDDTRHPHVASFLEKHHASKSYYSSRNDIVHRGENSTLPEYHAGNFFDYGATLPRILFSVIEKIDAPRDLFAQISGAKRVASYDPPEVTFVDSIFENILRACAFGKFMSIGQRRALELAISHCGQTRVSQLADVLNFHDQVQTLESRSREAKHVLMKARESALQASGTFAG